MTSATSGRGATGLVFAAALTAALAAGCDGVSRPDVAFPEVALRGLDGGDWSRERLAGRPWVINLWVPG